MPISLYQASWPPGNGDQDTEQDWGQIGTCDGIALRRNIQAVKSKDLTIMDIVTCPPFFGFQILRAQITCLVIVCKALN